MRAVAVASAQRGPARHRLPRPPGGAASGGAPRPAAGAGACPAACEHAPAAPRDRGRHDTVARVAACATAARVPSGATHARGGGVQQPAGAVSLPRVRAPDRRAPKIHGLRAGPPDRVLRVVLGPPPPRPPRSFHRLDARGTATPPPLDCLKSPVSHSPLGPRPAFGQSSL